MNNTNQITPEGELRYDPTGSYTWNDPYTGLAVNIPTFTATQIRSPQQQAISDQIQGAQFNMAGIANQQSGSIAQHLAQPFSTSGAPAAGDISQLYGAGDPLRSIGYGGPGQQFTFGDAGQITRDYGPADNYSQDRLRVEDALYGRLNPQLERERGNIEQRLSDQGIRYGSQAYTSAMDDYNRQANDARLAVTQVGGQEQQRLNDMEAQRAGFQNAAQQQAYTQNLGRGQFFNAAQRDAFSQAALNAQFIMRDKHKTSARTNPSLMRRMFSAIKTLLSNMRYATNRSTKSRPF